MASHGNDLFPHWHEEVGCPSVGNMDDMCGADITAGRMNNIGVDGETRSVRVQPER